jgi:DNA-binding LacI/PurR family transcriptional regulator
MKGIRALARHLDISIGTVSKALNNRSDINPETRKRVLQAAADLGYVANQSGRSLRQGTTQTVGFMIESNQAAPTDSDNFFMAVFDGVQSIFRRHHLDLIVLPCASDEDPVDYLGRMVGRGLVDALIISATRKKDPRVPMLSKAGIPFVALGRSSDTDHAWVELDFEGVAERSVDRLVERGHTDIAVALPATGLNLGNLFLAGYKRAIKRHRIAYRPEYAVRTESSDRGGYELGTTLLALKPRPSAVLLSYELLAAGLYSSLIDAGFQPGRDMAVIGFRESFQNRHLMPHLTSYSTSLRDLGIALGEILLSQMPGFAERYKDLPSQKIWPLTLVPGDSDPARSKPLKTNKKR